jgi:4-amino-4-deoxy-L-arabinose transferase-like glycosyltransferase
VGLVALSLSVFFHDLSREPLFMDESAYVSQSYFFDLLARPDDPLWLEYPAFDLPPLPKYAIGLALRVAGQRLPGRAAMVAWYNNPEFDCTTPATLYDARIPSVFVGTIGVIAVFAIGCASMGPRGGTIAALLMIANPLYRLHARRAMSDDYAEAFLLLTAALAIRFWMLAIGGRLRRRDWIWPIAVGVMGGLAVLSKLNGGLGLMIVAGWVSLALILPKVSRRAKWQIVAMGVLAAVVAYGTFIVGNPFLTARPPLKKLAASREYSRLLPIAELSLIGRTRMLIDHRVEVSKRAQIQKNIARDALNTLGEKFSVVFVQGFGRFGPFGRSHSDSTKRYDLSQDWGAFLYLPIFFVGAFLTFRRGARQYRENESPTAWATLIQSLIAFFTVTLFIPLAWDRYFLSIQAGSTFLAAGVVVASWDRLKTWLTRTVGKVTR